MWLRYVRSSICYSTSVYLSVVCLSVTFVHSTEPVEIFGNVFMPFCTHPLISLQNFTEIFLGKPLRQGLNVRGVAKYNEFGHVEGYISKTV